MKERGGKAVVRRRTAASPSGEIALIRRLPPAFSAALRCCSKAERCLVGVSGGRDSVALLHGLVEAGYGQLVVCHLDHGLRGAASEEDARFVRQLADTLKLPVEVAGADVRGIARHAKASLEAAARSARHAFFAATAERHDCRTILLAHHADDQAETVLFNLLRGAGPAGLGAMAVDSERKFGRQSLRLLRPLLGVWRSEIDAYLLERGLEWREDATNADPAHATRNALRHEALPLLERVLGRDVRRALWRTADILAAEDDWLAAMLAAEGPPPVELLVADLSSQPLARQRRVIRRWLTARGIAGVGYDDVERVRALLQVEGGGPAKVNLPGDRHARRRAGKLFVE